MKPNPFKALLYSRKFWLLILDTVISLILYFAGKYAAPVAFEDIKTVILAIQPIFVTVILAIAWEDAAEKGSLAYLEEPKEVEEDTSAVK